MADLLRALGEAAASSGVPTWLVFVLAVVAVVAAALPWYIRQWLGTLRELREFRAGR